MRVLLLWSQVNAGVVVVKWLECGCCCCGVRGMRVLVWSGLNAGVVVEWVECGCCFGECSFRVLSLN